MSSRTEGGGAAPEPLALDWRQDPPAALPVPWNWFLAHGRKASLLPVHAAVLKVREAAGKGYCTRGRSEDCIGDVGRPGLRPLCAGCRELMLAAEELARMSRTYVCSNMRCATNTGRVNDTTCLRCVFESAKRAGVYK